MAKGRDISESRCLVRLLQSPRRMFSGDAPQAIPATQRDARRDAVTARRGLLISPGLVDSFAPRYRLVEMLATDPTEALILAEQTRVGERPVLLRVLRDPDALQRFQNEAAVTGRIDHPNVATIYELGETADGVVYLAMEFTEGTRLNEILARRGPLPIDEAVEIACQCCSALHAAHRLGIVHRDVKPDHIVVGHDPEGAVTVRLLGFGLAKLKESTGHTVTGNIVGTPTFMSYEQATGVSSAALDGRSDIYSLGAVLYAMLVGQPPFSADTLVGCILQHLTEVPPSLRAARSAVSPALEAAVLRALEKDRDRRYPTASEFAAALRAASAFAQDSPSAPAVASVDTSSAVAAEMPPPPWRRRMIVAEPTPEAPIGRRPVAS